MTYGQGTKANDLALNAVLKRLMASHHCVTMIVCIRTVKFYKDLEISYLKLTVTM